MEIPWDKYGDLLPQGIFEMDLQGNLRYANQFLLDIMGFTRDEVKKGLNILSFIDPLDKPRVLENIQKMIHSQISLGNEYTLITKAGKRFPAAFYNTLIYNENHEISGINGIMIDITEKKHLQEELIQERNKFQKLLDESAENQNTLQNLSESGIFGFISVYDYKIVYVNQKFAEILGKSKDEIINTPIKDFINYVHLEDRWIIEKVLRSNKVDVTLNPIQRTFRICHPDNRIVWVMLSAYNYEKKSIPASHMIFVDITEQKQMENQREEERIRTQRLESLGLLAGGIAHDFNNILMGIMGNLQLMSLEESCNPTFKEYITELEKMIKNATGLTSQLLTFSKGGEPLQKSENIIEILENSCSLTLRGKKTTYQLDYELVLPNVYVDKAQIIQVFNNLILNADQAMNFGGIIRISVNLATQEEQHIVKEFWKFVRIKIADNGKGIPEELKDKIFSPYFTTKERGHGLGLATAYSIIKRHHGVITFQSEHGIGTTFYIYLPISETISKPMEIIQGNIPNIIKGRVLVLEDDVPVLTALERMLKEIGLEVETGIDGQEVIQKYIKAHQEGNPFDILIMDLTIPNGMGGKDALDHLLDFDPNVKAIVSSGYSVDLPQYQKYGFQGMLNKPYSLDELKKVILPFLNKKR